ncbi:UvrD-helicase domain-containing protein [Cellulosimicrobium sp. Marseille-Q4280]|uniref:HelD family protein n=1 Tax=Cellulosimicrobium sp. Marseille-Q4280 TaxID=2937992 RepID=UPI00203D960D|nr:UvrD-helicase domain-containing protein [Cellulosimicrobium sp. Marseille-Q4280]
MDSTRDVEQSYFDDVYEIRERKRQFRAGAYVAAADTKARTGMKRNSDADQTLGKPSDPAAFLRIDTLDGGCHYVGNAPVQDGGELYVISWKSDVALELRSATVDDARGVARLRNFACLPTNVIDSIGDQILAELAQTVADLDDSDLGVAKVDAMLQDVLSSAREPEMRKIVETIQAAQAALIGSDADRLLVIQGGPGTGKTAVALHRLSVILFQQRSLTPDDVLVVGPSKTFARYIGRVMPELGDDKVRVTDLAQMLGDARPSYKDTPDAARLKGDVRMVGFVSRALRDRVRAPEDGVTFTVSGVGPVTIDAGEVSEAIGRSVGGPLVEDRSRFREALKNVLVVRAREAAAAARVPVRGDIAMRIDGTEVEAAVARIWPTMSPRAFLASLYGSFPRLIAAAGSVLLAEEVALLQRSVGSRVADQQWSSEDLFMLDEVAAQMGDIPPARFAHIVVDEAQDLSPMQVRAVARRSRDGAMTMVGDIAQSTGHWARDSWSDVFDLVETSLPKDIEYLDIGYRVPRSVMDVAARLLPHAAPDVPMPRVVRDVEQGPRFVEVDDPEDIGMRVADVVQEHSSRGRFVGVICPDRSRAMVESTMRRRSINWQDVDAGGLSSAINLVSPVASKGLEFDSVVVVDPSGIVEAGPQGLRMLFVALTRTTAHLDIVYSSGELPVELLPPGQGRDDAETAHAHFADVEMDASGGDSDAVDSSTVAEKRHERSRIGRSSSRGPDGVPRAEDLLLTPRQEAVVESESREILAMLRETVAPAIVAAVLDRALVHVGSATTSAPGLSERQERVVDREAADVVGQLEETLAPTLHASVLRRAIRQLD